MASLTPEITQESNPFCLLSSEPFLFSVISEPMCALNKRENRDKKSREVAKHKTNRGLKND